MGTVCCSNKDLGLTDVVVDSGDLKNQSFVPPKISPANILDERNPNEEQYLSEVGSATGSDDDGGNRPASVFLQELYPGLAAEKVTGITGHRPQTMCSGHVKPGLTPVDVAENLVSRGYRALLNIQESWEPEYMDLEAAATSRGLCYIHIPVPHIEEPGEGMMYEDKFTLDLARQIGVVMLELPRPIMIMSRTGKRASAVWFFSHVVKRNLSSAQVMMLTASAGLGFASDPPLLYWVGRFMMMVDAERTRNRKVFGDLKFEGANLVYAWDPFSSERERGMSQDSIHSGNASKDVGNSPKNSGKASKKDVRSTTVTGPDGKPQTYGDTLAGWSLDAPCPFSHVVFPGFIDSELEGLGKTQTTFGRFRLGGFGKFKTASWLVDRQYRSLINLGHSEDIDFIDCGNECRELGLEYMHIPVHSAELMSQDERYSLNLARILALSILGMPRPLMVVSGGMRRASAAWTFAHAVRWDLGSAEVQKLSLSSELNFTLSPKLKDWVDDFMEVADRAIKCGSKVLGDIEITGQNLPCWHLDLSVKPSS
jgi:protein tyrosine phosphatase (PTP) superfamily phosphohydrolase (DUF442 family)